MLLQRKAYNTLKQWKDESKGSTAMLIDGARRVGKSFLAQEFAKNEYKSYILINFLKVSKEIKDIFFNDLIDLDLFFNKLSLRFKVQLFNKRAARILPPL